MHHVFIVNGKPRAGKDTVVEMLGDLLKAEDFTIRSFSSIDPVREMLDKAGIDTSKKTEADRTLLAVIGAALEQHSKIRSRWCIDFVVQHNRVSTAEHKATFLHIRERHVIDTVESVLRNGLGGFRIHAILVTSPRAENVVTNAADRDVHNWKYGRVIHNDSTLDDLRRRCQLALVDMNVIDPLSALS